MAGMGTYRQTGVWDTDKGQFLSGMEVAKANILVRAHSAAYADALSKVVALRPAESGELLKMFGAQAVTLSAVGAEAFSYAS